MTQGQVVGLHRTPSRRAPLESLSSVAVAADRGVEGDHHQRPGSSRQVMLVEAEVLDDLRLQPGAVREQVAVRGLHLAAGDVLSIGEVQLEVVKPRNPCEVMNSVRAGLRAELEGRAGWCARALTSGTITVGDPVVQSRIDDDARVVELRAALIAWERGAGSLDDLADLVHACARSIAELQAVAGDESSSRLYRLHDVASTLVLDLARQHPEAAAPIIERLTKTYRAG